MKNLIFLLIIILIPFKNLFAQGCSICTQTASNLGEKGASGLNTGIIYLAFLPITLISVIGYVWWRNNRSAKS